MTRPDIDWHQALSDADWLAGSTADTAERNLARAYLALLTDAARLRMVLDEARGVAPEDEA